MELTRLFLDELTREAARTKRALEQVPAGRDDWKPHDKSMPLGRLAGLVATMPMWIDMVINKPELDVAPKDGGTVSLPSHAELVSAHDAAVAAGRRALEGTTDGVLLTTNWKLLAGGHVVMDQPRRVVLRDTINHLAHHRGQLTVYLRLVGAPVPAIYGPSADDQRFA